MEEKVPLLICDKSDEGHIRKACRGSWMGFSVHHHFFAWQRDLSDEAIKGRRIAEIFDSIVNFVLMLVGVVGLLHMGILKLINFYVPEYLEYVPGILQKIYIPLWLLIIIIMFVMSRLVRTALTIEFVKKEAADHPYDDGVSWESVAKYHHGAFNNIAYAFAPRAMVAFEEAALKSHKAGVEFSLYTLFEHLLETPDVKSILIRFELPPDQVVRAFHDKFLSEGADHAGANGAMWQTIAKAYLDAAENDDPKVTVFHLFDACLMVDPKFGEFFEQLGVQPKVLDNGVQWFRFMNHLSGEMRSFRRAAFRKNTSDTGAAMTGLATPLLNSIGEDLTKAAKFGYLPVTVGRTSEIGSMLRAFESGASSVILTGQQGVGKMSIVEGLAERMVTEDVPEILKDKRLIRVPITHIVSGSDPGQYQQRLMQVMVEAVRSGNTVLAFEGIEGLFGVRVGGGTSQDLSDTLAELLEKTRLTAIATTTNEAFRTAISGTRFGSMATKLEVNQVEDNDAIQILESRVFNIEAHHTVYFTYRAIEQCVTMARRFLQDEALPENAIKLMQETAVYVRNKRGANQLVRAEDVGFVITEKTNIPTEAVNQDEKDKLLRLEDIMHERVVGQDEAVKAVSAALRRARADLSGGKRPIANFLFLGPTGVGKTETAKTLAEVYFGGEDRMTRFDMSEFQDAQSIYRLIGQPGQQGTGLLTEAIRQNPFTLLLLDEFEKADASLLNVFLQIFDDGRVTDSVGRVVDFTNTIIICTSNAGSNYIQDEVKAGTGTEIIKQGLLDQELKKYFRPELINRFDGVIVYTPLNEEQIEDIAHLMIGGIEKRLYEQKGINLDVTERAVAQLAIKGYSPEFGARPMRRVIQSDIEDVLANILLEGRVQRNQTIVIDVDGAVNIE
ncbi:MAG: hypothetical protein CMI52_03615 [Parcubacteria group bacterium]|nr:hypothetical protein [Parcubacteria group bacterium]